MRKESIIIYFPVPFIAVYWSPYNVYVQTTVGYIFLPMTLH